MWPQAVLSTLRQNVSNRFQFEAAFENLQNRFGQSATSDATDKYDVVLIFVIGCKRIKDLIMNNKFNTHKNRDFFY